MGRLPEPLASRLFYYALEDELEKQSKGKSWTWCEVRPDVIVGFAPNGSTFGLAGHWASYLSLYALVEGKGAKVPFPGTEEGYTCLFNEASAEIIAKFAIWASLHPDKAGGGQLFNIANQAKPESMRERWPAIVKHFGLEGVGPVDDPSILKPGQYVQKHKHVLEEHGIKPNEVWKGAFIDYYGYHLTVDRYLSLDKARSVGFTEEIDPTSSWCKAFDRFKKAGMIIG